MKLPSSLQSLVANKIKKFSSKENNDLLLVIDKWEDIIGQNFSKEVFPKFIKGKTLYLHVSSPTFSSQIRYMEEEILSRLSKIINAKKIERIKTEFNYKIFNETKEEFVDSADIDKPFNDCADRIPSNTDDKIKKSLLNFSKNIKR